MPHQPSAAEVLASASLGGFQGDPVIEAIAAARAGRFVELRTTNPLILVDTIRTLAILGEHATVDRAAAAWADLADGSVQFEAGIAALMVPNRGEALARLQRAVTAPRPQPMAWNSLAILHLARVDLPAARAAIDAGLAAMPGDPLTARTAALMAHLESSPEPPGPGVAQQVALLIERFSGHAAMAREAGELLGRLPAVPGLAEARALLARRADELEGGSLHRRDAAPSSLTTAPTVTRTTRVSVEATAPPKVRVALSPAEVDRLLDGHTLAFTADLPEGRRLVHVLRDDAALVSETPQVRLRLSEVAFRGVRGGATATPLLPDFPFVLELGPATLGSPPPVPAAPTSPAQAPTDARTDAGGYAIGGVMLAFLGGGRWLLGGADEGTTALILALGCGLMVYGGFLWVKHTRSV